jgi:hypothetical protein
LRSSHRARRRSCVPCVRGIPRASYGSRSGGSSPSLRARRPVGRAFEVLPLGINNGRATHGGSQGQHVRLVCRCTWCWGQATATQTVRARPEPDRKPPGELPHATYVPGDPRFGTNHKSYWCRGSIWHFKIQDSKHSCHITLSRVTTQALITSTDPSHLQHPYPHRPP